MRVLPFAFLFSSSSTFPGFSSALNDHLFGRGVISRIPLPQSSSSSSSSSSCSSCYTSDSSCSMIYRIQSDSRSLSNTHRLDVYSRNSCKKKNNDRNVSAEGLIFDQQPRQTYLRLPPGLLFLRIYLFSNDSVSHESLFLLSRFSFLRNLFPPNENVLLSNFHPRKGAEPFNHFLRSYLHAYFFLIFVRHFISAGHWESFQINEHLR